MMTRAQFEQTERNAKDFAERYPDAPLRQKRKRGRPGNGISKAMWYSIQVEEFRQSGMGRAVAIKEVARLNRKRPEHISSCVKMIEEQNYDWPQP